MNALLNRQNIRRLALPVLIILAALLTAKTQIPDSEAAASYPFPGRAEDLAPGHYWYFSDVHAGGSKALDLVEKRRWKTCLLNIYALRASGPDRLW